MRNEDQCYICKELVAHKQATRAHFKYRETGGYEVELHKGWKFLCPTCLQMFLEDKQDQEPEINPYARFWGENQAITWPTQGIEDGVYLDDYEDRFLE